MPSKENFSKHNSITYVCEKRKNSKRTKFKAKKSSYIMHAQSSWKKFGMLDKVYFTWIQNEMINNIETKYHLGIIKSLTRSNIK